MPDAACTTFDEREPGNKVAAVSPIAALLAAVASYCLIGLLWSAAGRSDIAYAESAATLGAIASASMLAFALATAFDRCAKPARLGLVIGAMSIAAAEIARCCVVWSSGILIWRPSVLPWATALGSIAILVGVAALAVPVARHRATLITLLDLCAISTCVALAVVLVASLRSPVTPDAGSLLPAILTVLAGLIVVGIIIVRGIGSPLTTAALLLVALGLAGAQVGRLIGMWDRSPGIASLGQWMLPIAALGLVPVLAAGSHPRQPLSLKTEAPVRALALASLAGCVVLIGVGLAWDRASAFDLAIVGVLAAGSVVAAEQLRLREAEAEVDRLILAADELVRIANLDTTTGLPNRIALDNRLAEEFERATRYNHPLSLCVVDIDHFKRVNDSYGHAVGDHVLWEIGHSLRQAARSIDFVARYGGEEFVVIAPDTWSADAVVLAERIRASVEQLAFVPAPDFRFSVTASVGVAGFPEHAEDRTGVFNRADLALYRSKSDGRNRVTVATPTDS